MSTQHTNSGAYRSAPLPTPVGWADHRTRTVALNAWLAREEAVAAGAAAPSDPRLLGLPEREELLRALFQRFTTSLEGVLDNELEVQADATPSAAVRAAYRKAAAHRPADWRALQREAADPVVVEMTRRQHARIAARAGLSATDVTAVALEVIGVDPLAPRGVTALSPRARRRRTARVVARRAS